MGIIPDEDVFDLELELTAGDQPTPPPTSGSVVPETKQTSERKRASNAANAMKSTGPKTAEGKVRSSKNATTHGLYQEGLQPIQQGPFVEDPDEVHQFVARIKADLQPRDSVEEQLACRIGIEFLRGVRLERVEGTILSAAGAPTSPEYDQLKQQVATAADLVDYLDNPNRERPGRWRTTLVEFINSRTRSLGRPAASTHRVFAPARGTARDDHPQLGRGHPRGARLGPSATRRSRRPTRLHGSVERGRSRRRHRSGADQAGRYKYSVDPERAAAPRRVSPSSTPPHRYRA